MTPSASRSTIPALFVRIWRLKLARFLLRAARVGEARPRWLRWGKAMIRACFPQIARIRLRQADCELLRRR